MGKCSNFIFVEKLKDLGKGRWTSDLVNVISKGKGRELESRSTPAKTG